jgi:hypothetical protein
VPAAVHLYEGYVGTTPRLFSFIWRVIIVQKILVQNDRRHSSRLLAQRALAAWRASRRADLFPASLLERSVLCIAGLTARRGRYSHYHTALYISSLMNVQGGVIMTLAPTPTDGALRGCASLFVVSSGDDPILGLDAIRNTTQRAGVGARLCSSAPSASRLREANQLAEERVQSAPPASRSAPDVTAIQMPPSIFQSWFSPQHILSSV